MKGAEGQTAGKDMKAERPAMARTNADAEGRRNEAKSSTTTTGQAGAGAKLSTEQRTKITTVIKSQNVRPATNVNFSISVGTAFRATVGFHPLPAEIVTIYPDWRGYEFFLVSDQIVVVNPRRLRSSTSSTPDRSRSRLQGAGPVPAPFLCTHRRHRPGRRRLSPALHSLTLVNERFPQLPGGFLRIR